MDGLWVDGRGVVGGLMSDCGLVDGELWMG